MCEVVEEIVDVGKLFNYGLEVGLKVEFLIVFVMNINEEFLIILNGYKDDEVMCFVLLGRKLGCCVVVVVEKYIEFFFLVKIVKELDIDFIIGVCLKMMVKGCGKWESFGGECVKFGLIIIEIINVVCYFEE